MKGKFKILGHMGLALFLVSALMLALVPAVPVSAAATAVTSVWVEFPAADADAGAVTTYNIAGAVGLYRIHFKPTTALKRGVDTITVQFPDGLNTDMGPSTYTFIVGTACSTANNFDIDPDGPGIVYGYYNSASASYGGLRITVTTGVDIAAGSEVYLMIDDAASMVTGGTASTSAYKVMVNTNKDTTPVLSKGFYLGASADQVATNSASTISPTSAGATNVEYSFTFTLTEALTTAAGDTITVTFPYGTTVPSSMSASAVSVYDALSGSPSWYTCGEAPTIDTDLGTVKVTVPHGIATDAGAKIKFATTAGITNPTTAAADWGGTAKVGFIHTSQDKQDKPLTAYTVTYATATTLDFNYTSGAYSDKYTMINMYSGVLYLRVEDAYGNPVTGGAYASAEVTLSSSSATGNFYTGTTTLVSGTQALTSGAVSLRYKDSTAGTHTLTAAFSPLTSATWAMVVVSGVALYDSSNNLIHTYAPTSTSPVQENGGYHSGDYINDAITAAMQGDTVKLGDGVYELDTVITLDKKITLTSVNGASSTTLVPTTDAIDAINVGVAGTATYPVIIEKLTFDRLYSGVEFDQGVYNNGYDYITVRNCVFSYIQPTNDADIEYGATVAFNVYTPSAGGAANITSGTISNNTFNYCGEVTNWSNGAKSAAISMMSKVGDKTISGITVSGNTLSNCNGYGIFLKGYSSAMTVVASITNNTITNGFSPIAVADWAGSSATSVVSITGNTITSGYAYAIAINGANNWGVVIKNNTITDTRAIQTNTYAIRILRKPLSSTTTYVQYNSITGTNGYAIYVGSTDAIAITDVNCNYNWYGDASGPAYTAVTGATVTKSNPNGTGDKVSDRTFYYPWLHKSLADVVADNASYQACTMKLVSGWNTLSTPVKLIAEADAINELIPSGMTIGYWYDAFDADSDGAYWEQITTGYVLNACDAVYLKMSAVTYVLLKFNAKDFSTPSKSLATGWNLISLAYLSSSGKWADNAVASVYKTAANLPGYSQVVSPSLNATQTNMYGAAGASWAYSSGQTLTGSPTETMYAGLGYWVYMQNAATLAGFEITPIAPDLD